MPALRSLLTAAIAKAIAENEGFTGTNLEAAEMDRLASAAVMLTDDFAPVENLLAPVIQYSQEEPLTALLTAAEKCINNGDDKGAVKYALRALKFSHDDPDAHDVLGRAYYNLGRLDEAAAHIEDLLALESGAENAYASLAGIYIKKTDFNNAIRVATEGTKQFGGAADLWSLLGQAYLLSGAPSAAVDPLLKALQLNPNLPEAANYLQEAKAKSGR
jgi:tetratricopeptide (TPR) repeat protein